MRALQADGEATGEVFKIIEALKGNAPTRNVERLSVLDEGRRLLEAKPDILTLLEDREALRTLGEDSLGATYLRFVEIEDLSADGLMDAAMEAPKQGARNSQEIWFAERQRDTHDLHHVVTGYGRDGLGEVALLEFDCTQTKSPGIRYIINKSNRSSKKEGNWTHVAPVMAEAKANALSTSWLIARDWEALMPLPLDEVRAKLGITAPGVYKDVQAAYPDEKHPPTEYEIKAA
jgi:ubiquinone biosynthesis protein COQ4